ncbi:hypothetical protein RSAG8_06465, partial [Rhizoctonia solani AG-8 WAC10335]
MLSQLRWLFIPALALQATALSLKGPKFAVTSAKASIVRAETIELDAPLTTVNVGKTENLRVSFTVLGDDGNPVRPHQAFGSLLPQSRMYVTKMEVELPPTNYNPYHGTTVRTRVED